MINFKINIKIQNQNKVDEKSGLIIDKNQLIRINIVRYVNMNIPNVQIS
jgi:hypothetical protein